MRFRLTVPVSRDFTEIHKVKKVLEENLGPGNQYPRMTFTNFFAGDKWAIDLCASHHYSHWELRIHKRYTSRPWFTELLLKYT